MQKLRFVGRLRSRGAKFTASGRCICPHSNQCMLLGVGSCSSFNGLLAEDVMVL